MEEPSVLDYVKSKLFFWRQERIEIPASDSEAYTERQEIVGGQVRLETGLQATQPPLDEGLRASRLFPVGTGGTWLRLLVPVGVALLGQRALEPPGRSALVGIVLYLVALVIFAWGVIKGEWRLTDRPSNESIEADQDDLSQKIRPVGLFLCLLLGLAAFLMFGNNHFTRANLVLWLLALVAFLFTFWFPEPNQIPWWQRLRLGFSRFLENGLTLSPWSLLVLAVFGLAAFYRFYLLDQVPAEMFSDHAEKLLDVRDVIDGQYSIYFPRNTGREAFQMYLTAAVATIFKTGLSFLSLKLGTAICGVLTLPFIYLLGVEVANRRVGLLAMFFAGVAYWPNVISRVALRFTLYPTFAAPVLYFLVRGLQRRSRNDFILAGIFLGIGLHGYSPFRFMPIVVLVAVGLYWIHRQSLQARLSAIWNLLLLATASLIVFLPLLRFWISNPNLFSYRMMTRMGQAERAFQAPLLQIFLNNLWRSLIMPFWDNGQIWVHSVPIRPALGVVPAVFFGAGVCLLVVRYFRKRNWLDLFWLVAIPLLMMPSILSLAFPDENPSLNRSGGALIVVFLIVGLGFDRFLSGLQSRQLSPGGRWVAWIVGIGLLVGSAVQDYDLVFNQYANQFKNNAWNTSELGAVIRQFADSYGAEDSAWVVPYPHWVDTRLVGIRAGYPLRDYALWRENIPETLDEPRAKLYLVKPEDVETLELLQSMYPTSVTHLFQSQVPGREFYMVTVPPAE